LEQAFLSRFKKKKRPRKRLKKRVEEPKKETATDLKKIFRVTFTKLRLRRSRRVHTRK
jgi:hypothetical protein